MQIPAQLHAFPTPTLLVATDNVHAKLYLAKDRSVEPVGVLSTKADLLDQERHAVQRGGVLVPADPEDDRQDWSREQLYEKLSPELLRRLNAGEFEALAFTVPHENVDELKESLHIDLLKRAVAFVPKNLVGEELVDLVAHIQEAS